MPEILIVCTANICRSPMAQALLADRLRRTEPDGGWRVTSAGIWAREGDAASEYSLEVMALRDLDLRGHRSQPVTAALLASADLVLAMTRQHREVLLAEFPEAAGKVHLLSQMVGKSHDIRDPYGYPAVEYERAAVELESLIDEGLARMRSLASRSRRV